jgi:hypothetical protein
MKHPHAILFICSLLFFTTSSFAQPASWSARGIGGGGSFFSPSINPGNTSEYYVGSDMADMFHTTDYGLNYTQLPFNQFESGWQSKMCYTSTPGLLYSISYNNVSGYSFPVKSTDNGVTWVVMPGADTTQNTYTVDVDYNNPGRVVLSYYGQICFSSNGGTSFSPFHTATVSGDGNTVGGVFFDGANIYVGTNDGVLVSTTSGVSWITAAITGIPATEKIMSFAAGRVGTVTRFFALTAGTGNWFTAATLNAATGGSYAGFTTGVYTCSYGAGNWVSSLTGINLSSDYPTFIAMAGNDVTTAYISGGSSASAPIVLKTANSGTSWTHVFNTTNNQNIQTGWCGQGGDHNFGFPEVSFGMSVAPTNSSKVIFGTFSDVHKTSDGGLTWQQAYLSAADENAAGVATPTHKAYHSVGLEPTTCWQIFWITSQNLFACYTDIHGINSLDGGNSWAFNNTGTTANTTYRIAKGSNGTLYAGTSGIHDMYQSTHLTDAQIDKADANGQLISSVDNGLSWQVVHSFGHPVYWIVIDPNNPNRAYASVINHAASSGSAGGVYRCDNLSSLATSTWTLLPTLLGTEGHPASLNVLNDGTLVATFSGRNASPFTASSGCFTYNPTAGTWKDVSDPGMKYWTQDVTIDPNDATQNTWYAGVFSAWGGKGNGMGGIYKTINRGVLWKRITSTANITDATSCTFNPANPNEIYIASETQGLWRSTNVNAASPTFSRVTNYPFQQPERVFFNPFNTNEVWISSFGNGMKMGLLIPTHVPEFESAEGFSIYPNPSDGQFYVLQKKAGKHEQLYIFNILGEQVKQMPITEGLNEVDLKGIGKGVYIVRLGNQSSRIIVN